MATRRKKELSASKKPKGSGMSRGFRRNPVDVRAGIDASKIGFSPAAQRTATEAEIADFQKTGRSKVFQERLRATARQPGAPGHEQQARVDARNVARGFRAPDEEPIAEAPVIPVAPQEQAQAPLGPSLEGGLSTLPLEGEEASAFEKVEAQIAELGGQTAEERLKFLSQVTPFGGGVAGASIFNALGRQQIGQAAQQISGQQALIGIRSMVSRYGSNLVKTGGLTSPNVASTAAGKATTRTLGKATMNTKNAKKTISYLSKIASAAKNPFMVLGALSSYVFGVTFAFNEGQGDVATTLSIAFNNAEDENDQVGMDVIQEAIDEIDSAANIAQNFIPVLGVPLGIFRKIKAARLVVEQGLRRREGGFELSPAGQQEEEKFAKIAADREARDKKIEESIAARDARFDEIEKDRRARAKSSFTPVTD